MPRPKQERVATVRRPSTPRPLAKAPTGISGLDELTSGGLPRARPTLLCGGAGCGKTVLGLEFLVRGVTQYGEPGAIFTFEERGDELAANVGSFGFDLPRLVSRKLLVVDHVEVERSEIAEAGDYNLDGLFIRLAHAIDSVGAKRVLLDTIEVLFAGLDNKEILRSELHRLFRWLKDRGVTVVITGERGEKSFTRYGIEEYVSDCVILLDLRVEDQISTRRLRVVKYRGARHGTDEYPFLIGDHGISLMPLSSLQLEHAVSTERVSSGNLELDRMLGGGYYRGSTILVSGGSGSGKTSVAASLASTCARGGRALYFSFEESPDQLVRNMSSIGLNLGRLVKSGALRIVSTRPSGFGLETHLFALYEAIEAFKPSMVVLDPITDFGDRKHEPDSRDDDPPRRPHEDERHHGAADQHPRLRSHRWLARLRWRRGDLVPHRHVDRAPERRGRRRAEPRRVRAQVPGHCALQPGPRVLAGRQGTPARGHLPRRGRLRHGLGPRSAAAARRVQRVLAPRAHRAERLDMSRRRAEPAHLSRSGSHRALRPGDFWELRLYVAGRTPRAENALANLSRACELHLPGQYSVEVIDLLENPRRAVADQIVALPTLVRRLPTPIKKIIGDLSNLERVLIGLELRLAPRGSRREADRPRGTRLRPRSSLEYLLRLFVADG